MRIFIRLAIFIIVFLIAYFAGAALLSVINIGNRPLMKIATRNPVIPGDFGFTLPRYQEIDQQRNIDIVFIGSSHCYRTYDTRIYAENNYRAFNMGTTGQTPLNSYYLLKAYLKDLNPRVVVFDLNYRVINRDGLESFYDLSTNAPYNSEFWGMALSIGNPHAFNEATSSWILDLLDKAPQYKQKDRDGEAYTTGGYVEFTHYRDINEADFFQPWETPENGYNAQTVEINADQLAYIGRTIELVQSHGAKIILLTKPEPRENLQVVANYEEISNEFATVAAKYNVPFWDFNKITHPLKTEKHFHDKEYLNPFGVKIFNPLLLRQLQTEGFLPENLSRAK